MSDDSYAAADGNYRIEVKDFGPIVTAAVDLRPLTVFIGPSNTGKSYLAMLVYALHQCFGASSVPRSRLRLRGWWFDASAVEALTDRDTIVDRIVDWWSASHTTPLPGDVAARVRPILERPEGAGRYLQQELCRCFGVDEPGDLVRRTSTQASAAIALSVPQGYDGEPVRYRFTFGRSDMRVSGQIPQQQPMSVSAEEDEFGFQRRVGLGRLDGAAHEASSLLSALLDTLFQSVIRPLTQAGYYLPADRTGVMHSHQVVVSTLIQSATTAGLRPSTEVPMLSGVLADFLNNLIEMSRHLKPSSRLSSALEELIGRRSTVGAGRNWLSDIRLSSARLERRPAPHACFFDGF